MPKKRQAPLGKDLSRASGGQQATVADPRRRSSSEDTRKRGAQPNNTNAAKHGFYSRLFKQRERRFLEELTPTDLSVEIELIRVANARFLEALQRSSGARDFEANLTALRAINLSAQSIAMLLRAQAFGAHLNGLDDDLLGPLPPPDDAPPAAQS